MAPPGDRILILRGEGYCGYATKKADSGDSRFMIDTGKAGQVAGVLRSADGKPIFGRRIQLLHPELADANLFRRIGGNMGIGPNGVVGYAETGKGGSFRFPKVSPGRYLVRVESTNPPVESVVDVKDGQEAGVELTLTPHVPGNLDSPTGASTDASGPSKASDRTIKRAEWPSGNSSAEPNLRYEVHLEKTEIEPYGGTFVDLELFNDGDEPVRLFWPSTAYPETYQFQITAEDGTALRPTRTTPMPPLLLVDAEYFKTIEPGGHLKTKIYLGHSPGSNCQVVYFRLPGEYRIEPAFQVVAVSVGDGTEGGVDRMWWHTIPAEPVTIRVDDKEPYSWFSLGDVTISGTVVDSEGNAIPDAEVSIERRTESEGSADGHQMQEIGILSTDSSGRFEFVRLPADAGLFLVRARHDKHPPVALRVISTPPRKEYDIQLTMEDGVTIRGRVVDTEGRPLPGILIRPYSDYPRKSGRTGKDGRFEIPGVGLQDDGTVSASVDSRGFVGRNVGASVDEATSGEWEIVLQRQTDLTFSGRARFEDGTPAAGMYLTFGLVDEDGNRVYVEKHRTDTSEWTDRDGRFTVYLQKPGTYQGEVLLQDSRDSVSTHGAWLTRVEGVSPGSNDVELVFKHTGRIEVQIKRKDGEPVVGDFRADLEMKGISPHERVRRGTRSFAGEERAVFDGLSPGEYTVDVTTRDPARRHWQETVSLPVEGEDPVVHIDVQIPRVETGRIRARVLEPFGGTVVHSGSFWINDGKTGWEVPFSHGLLEIRDLPIGKYKLYSRTDGFAEAEFGALVKPGELTDLGDLLLETEQKYWPTGWVEGKVLFEDGTAALGARLRSPDIRDAITIGADGGFRQEVKADTGILALHLSNVARWPRSLPPGDGEMEWRTGPASNWADTIYLPVAVPQNGTITKDITLPLSGFGDVSFEWLGDPPEIDVETFLARGGDEVFVCYRDGRQGWEIQADRMGIEKVPPGRRLVILRGRDFCGYWELGNDTGDETVRIDPSNVGSLRGTVKSEAGRPICGAKVVLVHPDYAGEAPVGGYGGGWNWIGRLEYAGLAGETETGDGGVFDFPRVASGRYLVRVEWGALSDESVVELKEGEKTAVELLVRAK
jgi:hypothetical protein